MPQLVVVVKKDQLQMGNNVVQHVLMLMNKSWLMLKNLNNEKLITTKRKILSKFC